MRGRGRGNTRGFPKSTRGSNNNFNSARSSTRNWERGPPATSTYSTQGASATTTGNRGIKSEDSSGLQWLPSVSRSSGLEPNGDALRSFETQEEYWGFIIEKILNIELPNRLASKSTSDRQEKEANVMILLRKLREGFVATKRRDEFAIQVVERSSYLALLYNSPINIASSFGYLLDVYSSSSPPATSNLQTAPNERVIGLLRFLHMLIDEYPSQRASHRLILRLRSDTPTSLPRDCPEWTVASEIASALRRNNWWALDKFTDPEFMRQRLTGESWTGASQPEPKTQQGELFDALPRRALFRLLYELRAKVRKSAWPVLRSAHREVVEGPWLERSLLSGSNRNQEAFVSGMAEFMRLAVERGEAGVKDASGVRVWILRRPA